LETKNRLCVKFTRTKPLLADQIGDGVRGRGRITSFYSILSDMFEVKWPKRQLHYSIGIGQFRRS